jgi:hypothetical protein
MYFRFVIPHQIALHRTPIDGESTVFSFTATVQPTVLAQLVLGNQFKKIFVIFFSFEQIYSYNPALS